MVDQNPIRSNFCEMYKKDKNAGTLQKDVSRPSGCLAGPYKRAAIGIFGLMACLGQALGIALWLPERLNVGSFPVQSRASIALIYCCGVIGD